MGRHTGSLRCEYLGVRGGVLADAIGYGKTACTIGLVDKTKEPIGSAWSLAERRVCGWFQHSVFLEPVNKKGGVFLWFSFKQKGAFPVTLRKG